MASSPTWPKWLADGIGTPTAVRALGAGTWGVDAGGRRVMVKTGAGVNDEAAGLRLLAGGGGDSPVPEVVLAGQGWVVTRWVDQEPRCPAHEEALGRLLATLHSRPWQVWGGGSSWIGACPVDPAPAPDGTAFYARRLSELARRCALEAEVSRVVARLDELLPSGGPALLHGDLWWGNVLWGAGARPWLIDPSVHGGHPEEDLAMLALFGDVPSRVHRAYAEVRSPEQGWQDRVALFQLYPLLVHTVLFGAGYRAQALAVARRYA